MAKSKTAPKMANLTADKATTKAPATKPVKAKVETKDLIIASSTEVENLTKAKALKLAPELIEAEGINDFKLGGVLQRIQEEKWWEGNDYESFKDYIETGLGLPYRKCMYLVNIYEKLVAAGIKWSDVKSIGWSKLRFIIDLLTEDNVAEWVKRADTMNSLEIQEYVKGLKDGKAKQDENGDEVTTKVSSMVFKVHPDQKDTIKEALAKKKEESGTEFDAVALEQITLGYIEGNIGKPKVTVAVVKKFLAGMTAEKAAALVIAVHPSLGDDDATDEEGDSEATG